MYGKILITAKILFLTAGITVSVKAQNKEVKPQI